MPTTTLECLNYSSSYRDGMTLVFLPGTFVSKSLKLINKQGLTLQNIPMQLLSGND